MIKEEQRLCGCVREGERRGFHTWQTDILECIRGKRDTHTHVNTHRSLYFFWEGNLLGITSLDNDRLFAEVFRLTVDGARERQCSSPSRHLPISFCADSLQSLWWTEMLSVYPFSTTPMRVAWSPCYNTLLVSNTRYRTPSSDPTVMTHLTAHRTPCSLDRVSSPWTPPLRHQIKFTSYQAVSNEDSRSLLSVVGDKSCSIGMLLKVVQWRCGSPLLRW